MSDLKKLRADLGRLTGRRWAMRWGVGLSALLLGTCAICTTVLLLDWQLNMSLLQRAISMAGALLVIGWVHRRYAARHLVRREGEIQAALFVERQHGIDSDLVAALQFTAPDHVSLGSPALSGAVVNQVAELSQELDVFEGLAVRDVTKRGAVTLATVVTLLAMNIVWPGFFAAFVDRCFLFGHAHYPTNTQIRSVVINGERIELNNESVNLRLPYGQPVRFAVTCDGVIPDQGAVVLRSTTVGLRTSVPLTSAGDAKNRQFIGELPRMVTSLEFQIYLGDAWTDRRPITVIALPVVQVVAKPVPPEYARRSGTVEQHDALIQQDALQLAVLEGSRLEISARSTNKTLSNAWVRVDEQLFQLVKQDPQGRRWQLPLAGTPFETVKHAMRFELQVKDKDGLQLEQPWQGHVRIKADRAPRVVAVRRVSDPHVLPVANPRIRFGVRDDFGVSRVTALVQLARSDGTTEEHTIPVCQFTGAQQPQLQFQDEFALELLPFKLVKGDEIKLTLQAEDYRGDAAAKTNVSEPLMLKVTD
ncbi:MAG: hypothetical protein ABGZ17_15195, partial [Planctomycetaceae bacterium]